MFNPSRRSFAPDRNICHDRSHYPTRRPGRQIIVGKEPPIRLAMACLLARGHLLIEDIPGVGKTTLAQTLARIARPQVPPHPVHQRPAAGRHPRQFHFRPRQRRVRLSPGPALRAGRPDRRNQPRHAQDAERAARGDGGTPGHGRRRDAPPARAVLRHRHAKPAAPDRHLPAAGIAARPLPHAHRAGLSRSRRPSARCCVGAEPPRNVARTSSRRCRPIVCSRFRRRCRTCKRRPRCSTTCRILLARQPPPHRTGLSPRAGLALLRAAQAWALMRGRDMVLPEDVQAVALGDGPPARNRRWRGAIVRPRACTGTIGNRGRAVGGTE